MIKLYYLDYLAIEGRSFLHRLSPGLKIIGMAIILFAVVIFKNIFLLFILYSILLSLFFISRLPRSIFLYTLYPLIFAILLIFISGFEMHFIGLIVLKVLCGSTGIIILFSTTPSPKIFQSLEKVLPSIIVTGLYITYRSMFILLKVLEETQYALYLRGGFQWRNPWRSLVNISNAFGHLIIKGIDSSENMYEAMMVRGFKNRIHYRD